MSIVDDWVTYGVYHTPRSGCRWNRIYMSVVGHLVTPAALENNESSFFCHRKVDDVKFNERTPRACDFRPIL